MTDAMLAEALKTVTDIEREMREAMQTEDLADRDAALIAGRHVIAARKSIESWIGLRAMRGQLLKT